MGVPWHIVMVPCVHGVVGCGVSQFFNFALCENVFFVLFSWCAVFHHGVVVDCDGTSHFSV